ncbi:hypothetical protein Pla123a_32650 [Posidoniimonas polymericola]|uniref:DUF1579 domain-containing protein n=1 Tax=Posidoniimonas polymericola TaxID=2528002 RepID=A0A5C5YI60_9BACT|nr:DUF1579 domain-containing protein [Posidoniimonas polymericola]TWT74442.1 hypothetical protein Pla123a_32650 [Posidoniimonas polymericola]
MKTLSTAVALTLLGALSVAAQAAETPAMPEMPQPTTQHQWLRQLTGDWTTKVTMYMPGQPPMSSDGHATTRLVGGFWAVSEVTGQMMGDPFEGLQTIGFDAEKQEYVGSWVDSMSSHQWLHRGQLNKAKNQLVLECKGPCPLQPGELVSFREVYEVKDADHLVFTSYVQGENSEWTKGMQIEYTRDR